MIQLTVGGYEFWYPLDLKPLIDQFILEDQRNGDVTYMFDCEGGAFLDMDEYFDQLCDISKSDLPGLTGQQVLFNLDTITHPIWGTAILIRIEDFKTQSVLCQGIFLHAGQLGDFLGQQHPHVLA